MTSEIGWGFDCEGMNVQHLIHTSPQAVWAYDSGSDGVPWTPNERRAFTDRGIRVYLVNQGYKQGPGAALHGDEFDLERAAWTTAGLTEVVHARREVQWSTRVYCTWSNYAAIKQALAEAGIGQSVYYRIADWNLNQHLADAMLHADVYAGQWASPVTNPSTVIPGTSTLLASVGADLNVVLLGDTGWAG